MNCDTEETHTPIDQVVGGASSEPNETGQEQPEKLLTASDVAELLSVHPNYVYDQASKGGMPSYKFGGNRRFRWSQVESWLQGTFVQPVSTYPEQVEGG